MKEDDLAELERRAQLLTRRLADLRPAAVTGNTSRERIFRLLEEYAQWRYEFPIKALLLRCWVGLILVAVITVGAWFLASTGAGQVLGLASLRDRVTDAYYAFMWTTRGTEGARTDQVQARRSCPGSIEQVIGTYMVVVCYHDGIQERFLAQPANVVVTNEAGFKDWASRYLLQGVNFDFYMPIGKVNDIDVWGVVVWYRKVPVNVQLVEAGLGYPEKNPPTAVVSEIFAQYYWRKAQHGSD